MKVPNIVAHLVIVRSIYIPKSKFFHICFTDVGVCLHCHWGEIDFQFLIPSTFSVHDVKNVKNVLNVLDMKCKI